MIEWDQATRLNTPVGDLAINEYVPGVGYFMADPARCSVRRSLRATKDSVPQGDGAILHRRFADGIELTVTLELWTRIGLDGEKACGQDLRVMLETLGLYLQSILNGRGRWFWTPSGYGDERMLDESRWLVDVARDLQGGLTSVTFGLDSPFPCFIDSAEQFGSETLVADGGTEIITNAGNHEAYPVIEVYGSTSAFTITNNSLIDQNGNPLQIVYDGTAIGGGDYAEIDVFKNSIYLNGNQANLKSGIDPAATDFFVLRPGDNEIDAAGADVQFRFNNSWVPV